KRMRIRPIQLQWFRATLRLSRGEDGGRSLHIGKRAADTQQGSGVFYRSVEGEGDGGDGILQQRHGTDKDSIYPASGRGGQHAKEPGGVHRSAQAVPEGRQRSLSCGSR